MPISPEQEHATRAVITALNELWQAIRERHQEVPDAVVVLEEPPARRRPDWGHLVHTRIEGAHTVTELLIDPGPIFGHLEKGPLQVLEDLLHQAAHGLGEARGVKDLVRERRYHNQRFRDLAAEVGLSCVEPPRAQTGYDIAEATDAVLAAYADEVAGLARALRGPWMPPSTAPTRSAAAWIAADCRCERPHRIRAAPALLETAAPLCPDCRQPYRPVKPKGASR